MTQSQATREYPVLGYRTRPDGTRNAVHYYGDKHLCTVVPNRGGKKTGVIAPNLIRNVRSSSVVLDPKGELATEFALWRSQFQRVGVFDPFHIVPGWALPRPQIGRVGFNPDGTYRLVRPGLRAGFNIIDMIGRSRHPVADAKMVSGAVIIPTERDPHWGNGARALFSAFLVFAALDPLYPADHFPRTIQGVWDILSLPDDEFRLMLHAMGACSEVCRGFVKREANRFLGGNENEVASIRSSIYTNCSSIFDDPEILDNLSETTIDFGDLQREPVTLFLCLPGIRSESHNRWFKLLLTCIFAAIEEAGLPEPDEQLYQPRTVFYMDEFGTTLGRMDTIRDALPRMPGYGVQFWPFIQDFNQLNSLYGKAWESFPSNSGVIQTFGGSLDLFTPEFLSKLTGQETRESISISQNTMPTAGIGTSQSFTGRPLYFPHEVAGINNHREGSSKDEDRLRQLLIFDGQRTFEAQRYEYFVDEPEYMKFFSEIKAAAKKMSPR